MGNCCGGSENEDIKSDKPKSGYRTDVLSGVHAPFSKIVAASKGLSHFEASKSLQSSEALRSKATVERRPIMSSIWKKDGAEDLGRHSPVTASEVHLSRGHTLYSRPAATTTATVGKSSVTEKVGKPPPLKEMGGSRKSDAKKARRRRDARPSDHRAVMRHSCRRRRWKSAIDIRANQLKDLARRAKSMRKETAFPPTPSLLEGDEDARAALDPDAATAVAVVTKVVPAREPASFYGAVPEEPAPPAGGRRQGQLYPVGGPGVCRWGYGRAPVRCAGGGPGEECRLNDVTLCLKGEVLETVL